MCYYINFILYVSIIQLHCYNVIKYILNIIENDRIVSTKYIPYDNPRQRQNILKVT